ncbi:unnamed protein product [Lampetra planeri]
MSTPAARHKCRHCATALPLDCRRETPPSVMSQSTHALPDRSQFATLPSSFSSASFYAVSVRPASLLCASRPV